MRGLAFAGKAMLGFGLVAALTAASPPPTAPVKLWRLDCGTVDVPDLDFLSDSFRFSGTSRTVAVSCYLIKHGDSYVLWDGGLPLSRLGAGARSVGGGNARLTRSIVDQLHDLGLGRDAISIVAISHYHSDHSGQIAEFPNARLVIGAPDWAVVRSDAVAFNLDRELFRPWTQSDAPLQTITGDADLFGDGSVILLATPGHTPGHHSLLVRLKHRRVILTGDLWHFEAQRRVNGVPKINTSRADTLASMDRIREVAATFHATVVIGHDRDDIAKLPKFPAGAE